MSDPLPSTTPPSARIGLDSDESLSLQQLRTTSVEQQQQVARQRLIHGLLPLALEDDAKRRAFTARITVAIIPDVAQFTHQVVERLEPVSSTWDRGPLARSTPMRASGPRSQGRLRPYALTASLAACLMIAVVIRGGDTGVATLARSESATWEQIPGKLTAGTRLHLTRGLAEIELHGSGKLVLEGPADLELASTTRAVLRSGRLVLHVTPAGHGYRVETPNGTLVDLGTRFGVSVGTDGATEAHVLEGAIAALAGTSTQEVILKADDAARLSHGRLEHVTADLGAFYSALPPHAEQTPDQLRWRLDDGNGATAHADVRGFSGAVADLTLKSLRDAPLPQWITGHHGGGLAFDGRGGFAESAFPGIAGTQARTVACWIRMPRDFTEADGFAIVSWGHFTSAGRGAVWQLSLNPLSKEGPLGRIRVGTHGGLLVGTRDLRDDAWHHVAVVMYGGARPDIGTHVLVYVDGELEKISRRTLLTIDTRITDGGHGVWIGRNVTYTDEAKIHPQGFLRGAVDDLVIAGGTLSQNDIRTLMDKR
ncbi:MAG TPA: LamG-like jellyroll fold domain-containing protein [Planctomycetota bacterium]|nr:LamG-like jellyroll fold domain-containing protein [Planctomycetota bacterium]